MEFSMPLPNSKQTKGLITMSERIVQENLEQFLQMAAQDLELQEKLKAASDRDAYVSLVVELGKEKGYNFTSDRVEAALDTSAKKVAENDELVMQLSEQELVSVAGGAQPGTAAVTLGCGLITLNPDNNACGGGGGATVLVTICGYESERKLSPSSRAKSAPNNITKSN